MDMLLNAAEASNIDKNGNVVKTYNKTQEDVKMNNTTNNYGEVVVEDIVLDDALFSEVEGALKASKYANIPSFFEGKTICKTADLAMQPKMYIEDAVYGKYKDETKSDFAAVAFKDDSGELRFGFVSREGLDFVRRLVDICKANKMSMKKLLEKVSVYLEVTTAMRKGHENETKAVLEDGTNNWFYKYDFSLVK